MREETNIIIKLTVDFRKLGIAAVIAHGIPKLLISIYLWRGEERITDQSPCHYLRRRWGGTDPVCGAL